MKKEHLFKPGQSGNPKGREPGKTPAAKLRQFITKAMPEILSQLVEQAKAGDVAAAKVLIDRVCPPLKPQALPIRGGTEKLNSRLSGTPATFECPEGR